MNRFGWKKLHNQIDKIELKTSRDCFRNIDNMHIIFKSSTKPRKIETKTSQSIELKIVFLINVDIDRFESSVPAQPDTVM